MPDLPRSFGFGPVAPPALSAGTGVLSSAARSHPVQTPAA
jgi:hypothetical protein